MGLLVDVGQPDRVGQVVGREPVVGASNGLIPQVLDAVAVALDLLGDALGALQRWAVGTDEVLGTQAAKVVEAPQQEVGVAELLSTDRKDVEEGWPHQIVDGDPDLGKPDRGGVVGIGGCGRDDRAESGDRGVDLLAHRIRHR